MHKRAAISMWFVHCLDLCSASSPIYDNSFECQKVGHKASVNEIHVAHICDEIILLQHARVNNTLTSSEAFNSSFYQEIVVTHQHTYYTTLYMYLFC